MRIIVKAKTGSKVEKVERLNQDHMDLPGIVHDTPMYKVEVREPPVDGKANKAIVRSLAKYFNTSQSRVVLVKGESSKNKVFEVDL